VDDEPADAPWVLVDVDGEPFEWRVVEAMAMESDGRSPQLRRRSRPRAELVLMMRRPSDDRHSFGVVQGSRVVPSEADVRDIIRSCRDTTSLALDWRAHERSHAREVAMYWGRLPAHAQQTLAETWLARCARRCGVAVRVTDPNDLHEVSAETLRAARELGVAPGDEEACAQEEDVRVAFERHVEPW
jgi:hypothetical protein